MSHRVLVTGAAGMVGSNLVPVLLERGWRVAGIDDLSMGSVDNLVEVAGSDAFELVVSDMRDVDAYRQALGDAEAVIHLAAKKIPKYGHATDTLLMNSECAHLVLDEAAANGTRVLMASTSDVYGMSPKQPVAEEDELVIGPSTVKRWAYAVSKLFDEHLALAYAAEQDVDVTLMRFFNSYGPHHHRSWWGGPQSLFIDAALGGETLTVHGDGNQQRCFTYASDLVEGIALCLESERLSSEVINLGNPDGEVPILELAQLVCELHRTRPAGRHRVHPLRGSLRQVPGGPAACSRHHESARAARLRSTRHAARGADRDGCVASANPLPVG